MLFGDGEGGGVGVGVGGVAAGDGDGDADDAGGSPFDWIGLDLATAAPRDLS
jgi:hypothetical protein